MKNKPRIKFNRTLNLWVCNDGKNNFFTFDGLGKTPHDAYINFYNRKLYINHPGVISVNYLGT